MKVAKITNNGLEPCFVENLTLNNDGALVKVLGCGLCGSDIIKINPNNKGLVLGHEVVGEIIEIRSKSLFKVGDRIVLGHHVPCNNCVYCDNKNYSMCLKFKSTNIFPGGFSEFIFVSDDHLNNTVFKVCSDISNEEVSFTEPLACCIRAVNRACLKLNSKVLVIGLGTIGILMCQVLKFQNFNVFGMDILDYRLGLIKNFDIPSIKFQGDYTINKIKNLIGDIGFDCIFLTCGATSAINFSVDVIRNGGKIVVFSSVKDNLPGFSNNEIYYRELNIFGSYSPSVDSLKEALFLLENKKIVVSNLFTVYNLDDINFAVKDSIDNKIMKAYIKP